MFYSSKLLLSLLIRVPWDFLILLSLSGTERETFIKAPKNPDFFGQCKCSLQKGNLYSVLRAPLVSAVS